MNKGLNRILTLVLLCSSYVGTAQISPGDLSTPHANLEGISNCTKCHVLGNKVSNDNCLNCHTEIKNRINLQKGYHSSVDVKGKDCFSCHSEHNGRNFKLIRLETAKFDHSLTGYSLSTPHAKQECSACHSSKFITDQKLKNKKNTFLGLNTECLTCHADYHRQTLPPTCLKCHGEESFKPAAKFNHDNARFQLKGKHQKVDCSKCHRIETVNGSRFQEFRGVSFNNCTSCHKDPHQNQFGQNCKQCHTEESFHAVKGITNFDHSKTNFNLEEKHQLVDCKSCHKKKYTDPLKHDKCTDCHTDYHNGQFTKDGLTPDCSQCHTVKGFTHFLYTVDQHNKGNFPLQGSHMATPCFDCHKKQEKWSFREIGRNCKDCHADYHLNFIQAKYYPESNCKDCHTEIRWSDVKFDHSKTNFKLTGGHAKPGCRACHFKPDEHGVVQQRFAGLSTSCAGCHTDNHFKQFEKDGITNCLECHATDSWKASKFDHNRAAFKLDGKHINVACNKCHKPKQEGTISYIQYKLKEYKCESCH